MMEWELNLRFKLKYHKQRAVVEYKSKQIIRIRVYGKTSSMLLENNYPSIRFSKSKKGVQWKVRQGAMKNPDQDTAQLLINIFYQLEYYMKEDFYKIFPEENTLFSE